MATPIYKLYLGKIGPEVLQMSEERRDEVLQKVQQMNIDTGVQTLVNGTLLGVDRYRSWGVERFPDWKALREHDRCLDELGFYSYLSDSITLLGVDKEDAPVSLTPPVLEPGVEYFAHIYFGRILSTVSELTEAQMAEAGKFSEVQAEMGIKPLIDIDPRPINEEWGMVGVALMPSMEALLEKYRAQNKMNWWRYIDARTYIGTVEGGILLKK